LVLPHHEKERILCMFFFYLYTYRVMPKDNRCPWLRLYRIAVAYCSWNRIFEFFYTYHIVHFCITKPLQTNIFALTKHVHRLLNPLTKTEMTSDNLNAESIKRWNISNRNTKSRKTTQKSVKMITNITISHVFSYHL
jgi:hypothetical protein